MKVVLFIILSTSLCFAQKPGWNTPGADLKEEVSKPDTQTKPIIKPSETKAIDMKLNGIIYSSGTLIEKGANEILTGAIIQGACVILNAIVPAFRPNTTDLNELQSFNDVQLGIGVASSIGVCIGVGFQVSGVININRAGKRMKTVGL